MTTRERRSVQHAQPPASPARGPVWRALLEAQWRARLQEVTELSLAYHEAAAVAAAAQPGRKDAGRKDAGRKDAGPKGAGPKGAGRTGYSHADGSGGPGQLGADESGGRKLRQLLRRAVA